MGKKTRKNKFEPVDLNIVYTTTTFGDSDPVDNLAELDISKEKAEELLMIRASLPKFSSSVVETELSKLPTEKPFRAFVHNVSFSATEKDVAEFFSPLEIVGVNMVGGDSGPRGCFLVDFATREDLAKALERNDSMLAGRPVNIRVATPSNNERRSGNIFGRDRFGGGRRSDGRWGEGYRPAALRDEMNTSSNSGTDSPWQRGAVSQRTSYGFSGSSFGGPRSSNPPPTNFRSPLSNEGFERPKINLLPRTVPRDLNEPASDRNARIFGSAKPVDTASRDREVEERLSRANNPGQTNDA